MENNKARKVRSKVLDEMLEQIAKDPWHVKLRRWIRIQIWIYTCLSRKYWDKTYSGYIFRKKK